MPNGRSYAIVKRKMFRGSDEATSSAYASAPVGIHGSVNSSDEDMIDIQHTGTTSDLNANGRLTHSGPSGNRNGAGGDEESITTAGGIGPSVDELPEPGMGH